MTTKDFAQVDWDAATREDCRQLIRLAAREDLSRGHDLTTLALVKAEATGAARIVFRQAAVLAGLPAVELALHEWNCDVACTPLASDGDQVSPGTAVAELAGNTRDLLTAERVLLNLLGRLSGVATQASRYVHAVAHTQARIYDTRKTTPGWRRLEKYAVRCGGAHNHRTGLFDAILIKDNHLAHSVGELTAAVGKARAFLEQQPTADLPAGAATIIEVEVDTLQQLEEALGVRPDIVLLDNMNPGQLREAVRLRDQLAAGVELEASGGINLDTIGEVAESGVDRISVGALTHAATAVDVGLDWNEPATA